MPHLSEDDPPRPRANKRRGHGTWDNDRPPILGTIGRQSGQVELKVLQHASAAELLPSVLAATTQGSVVNTDEWQPYGALPYFDRTHQTVCHKPGKRQWARDDDADGIREVHTNTIEGFWTGLRNFLRRFRGVSKWFLAQYSAVYRMYHNQSQLSPFILRVMCGCTSNPA